MTVRHWIAEVAGPHRSEHAEGPLWDDRTGELLWVDQYAGIVRWAREAADGSGLVVSRELEVGGPVGAVVAREAGGWMLAARDGFLRLDERGGIHPVATVLGGDGPRRRMNDGKVDPLGRFWAGSMAFDKTPGAGVLAVLDGADCRVVLDGVTISNGLAWSTDGSELCYIDTPTGVIRRYAVGADRELRDLGVIATAPPHGAFDGMCSDADGGLWVALWGAGEVHRFDPAGRLTDVVAVDAPQVSSCAFGGEDLGTLYITTSQEGYGPVAAAAHPNAGRIFRVRPGAIGLPSARFAG